MNAWNIVGVGVYMHRSLLPPPLARLAKALAERAGFRHGGRIGMEVNFSMINIREKTKTLKEGLISHLKSFFMQACFKNAIILWLLILTLAANLANWLLLKLLIQPVDFPIILHYNVYFGVDLKGNYWKVFSIPLIGLFLFFINIALAIYIYRREERIASYLLLIAALMIQINLIVYSLSIILINY